jgi:hypothetical protein
MERSCQINAPTALFPDTETTLCIEQEAGWTPGTVCTHGEQIHFMSRPGIGLRKKRQLFISVSRLQNAACKRMKRTKSQLDTQLFYSVLYLKSAFQETGSLPRIHFIPNFARVVATKWPKNYTLRLAKGEEMLCSFSFSTPTPPPPQQRVLRASLGRNLHSVVQYQ